MANGFHDFVVELFAGMGTPISVRRMFGGAGAYADGLMFALIADDVIYIKTDEALRAALTEKGCGPFIWRPTKGPRAGEIVEMSYWRLPEAALDDPDLAASWGRKALNVAKAKDAAKPAKKRKR